MKRLNLSLLVLAILMPATAESDLVVKFPEAKASLPSIEQFPTLAKLLDLDDPWKFLPRELATKLFPSEVKLVH